MMFEEDTSEPMWPEDEGSVDASEFDPFAFTLPGVSVTQKLRYLLSKGIIQPGPNTWRPPNDNTKLITLKCLYAAMVGFNKDRLSLLYSSGELGNTFDELWLTKAQEALSAPSVRDRCCGHVFEKGETYYRCKQCCVDPTVVICSTCFNTQDHRSHSVTMLVGEGTGGCCDCGDPEAFHSSAPRCGIHVVVPEREPQPIPEDVRRSIAETMATALDFAIDIFSTTPIMKEELKEDVCKSNAEESELVYAPSQDKEKDYGEWVAVLWNDDIRSYNDVQSQLARIDPVRYDDVGSYAVAKQIDTVGREAIAKDSNLRKVIEAATVVMRVGLFCNVRTERDYLRECVAGYILEWLMDCIAVGVSVGGDEMILREIMCQTLAGPWMRGIKQPDSRVELSEASDEDHVPSAEWASSSPKSGPMEERWVEGQYIRLDWILFFDARLWKSLRKCIKSIIMGCILGGKAKVAGTVVDPWGPRNWKRITGNSQTNKLMTGIRFARDFAQLCMLWLKYDREPDLSVTKLGVQIFTTPSISLELVQRYSFLTHLLAIEYTYFTTGGCIGRPIDVNPSLSFEGARDEPSESSWKPDVKIMQIQEEIHHLLGNEAVRRMIPNQLNWLTQFLDFVTLFQGMHVQKRETEVHREYESRVGDVAYNITAPITRLMGYVADGYEHATREELRDAFGTALSFTFNFCSGAERNRFPYSDPVDPIRYHVINGLELIDFKVAEEYVSLHYPLNWMLSLLVSKIVNVERGSTTDWNWWIPSLTEDIRHQAILTCVDYPLRAKVFCSQIRAKLWARNGGVMFRQYNQYNGPRAYGRSCSDFTFLQWGFAILPADQMLLAMLDRYDLLLLGTPYDDLNDHATYIGGSLKAMIQDFFQLFLHLMNDRDTVMGEPKENIVRREIVQRLIFKRLPYSDILRQVRYHTEVDIDDYFDKNLFEVANFHPPTEAKSGLYELKSEYYSLIDPHHRSYSRNQSVECERLLTEFLASKGVPAANPLIEPSARLSAPITGPFAGLTEVLGTRLFATVACRGITYSLENTSETIVDHILHLCLIAVMDQTTNRDFVGHATAYFTSYAPCLVQRLLDILNHHPEYTELYPKIRRLLSKMKDVDPVWFQSVSRFDVVLSPAEDLQAAAEAEQKKTLARQRQLAALNKIKLAQSKFQEDNKALLEESDSEDDFETIDKMDIDDGTVTNTFEFPHGTCILCQEETNDDEPYGLPITIHQSPLFRMTPLDNDTFIAEVARTPASLDTVHERPSGQAHQLGIRHVIDSENQVKVVTEKVLGVGFPRQAPQQSLTVTTCGHLVHDKCWNSYFTSVKVRSSISLQNHSESVDAGEFLCPLCRALSNAIIPIVWNDGVQRVSGIPAFSSLSLQQLPSWLDEQRQSLLSCSVTQTIQNIDGNIVEVLPRVFPSLSVEPEGVDNHTTSLEYNKSHDNGRIRMYDDLIQQTRRRLLMYQNGKRQYTDLDYLCVLLAGTITSTEIAQRGTGEGIGADLYPPVLGAISSQNLMLLRVLAETIRTLMIFRNNGEMGRKIHKRYYGRMNQLVPLDETDDGSDSSFPTILKSDLFERFVIACGISSAAFGISVDRLLLLHYLAEVTKIILAILGSAQALKFILTDTMWPVALEGPPLGPRGFLRYLVAQLEREPSQKLMNGLYYMAQRFILPFLRKAVIFSHVYEGIIFSGTNDTNEVESDRLCHLLGLPTLAEVLDMDITTNVSLSSMIQNWTSRRSGYDPRSVTLELHHPAVFELIGLPTRLDVLLELASKFHCPECGQVPDEPTVCLLCGAIVCSQNRCCSRFGVGEMNLHRKKCTRSIGVFLWLKRNSIVLLRQPPLEHSYVRGDLRDAPYLNVHGESERDVRAGHPQFLSQERYDKSVRAPLLKHAIETGISRKFDGMIDIGGWETF